MKKAIDQLVCAPLVWRIGLLISVTVLIGYFFYQNLFAGQLVQIQQQDSQLLEFKNQIQSYSVQRNDIFNETKLFSQQNQALQKLNQITKNFNRNAPEQNLLKTALSVDVKPQEVQISAALADEFGQYYLVKITTKSDLDKISRFLTLLINQVEFAVWERLEISKQVSSFDLNLAVRYYFELLDETSG